MTDKDPKGMTASELLRWAGNGDEYISPIDGNSWTVYDGKLKSFIEWESGDWPNEARLCDYLADKIDAELAQAREESLLRGAELWAMANGWPGFRDGEDFGAWLDRCTYKKLVDDCNEPVQFGEEIELHYRSGGMDKGRFQEVKLNKGPVSILSFTGVDHAREYRYDSECDTIKRPAPEALGADGMPIVAGETVYMAGSLADTPNDKAADTVWAHGGPLLVLGESDRAGYLICKNDMGVKLDVRPEDLSHTPPDTQERIDEDAKKGWGEYWGCCGNICAKCGARRYDADSCGQAMRLDLLRRQRELDKRAGGAE